MNEGSRDQGNTYITISNNNKINTKENLFFNSYEEIKQSSRRRESEKEPVTKQITRDKIRSSSSVQGYADAVSDMCIRTGATKTRAAL